MDNAPGELVVPHAGSTGSALWQSIGSMTQAKVIRKSAIHEIRHIELTWRPISSQSGTRSRLAGGERISIARTLASYYNSNNILETIDGRTESPQIRKLARSGPAERG